MVSLWQQCISVLPKSSLLTEFSSPLKLQVLTGFVWLQHAVEAELCILFYFERWFFTTYIFLKTVRRFYYFFWTVLKHVFHHFMKKEEKFINNTTLRGGGKPKGLFGSLD
jgi:hypothetical protein